jgi:hypothetical protein
MSEPFQPTTRVGGGKLRRVRPGGEYTEDETVELEGVEPDAAMVPESEQVGDLEHEGGPDDGGN